MSIESHRTFTPSAPCPKCNQPTFAVSRQNLEKYLLSQPIVCSSCNSEIDWWSVILYVAKFPSPFALFTLVGATMTIVEVRMKRDQQFLLDLSAADITNDSRILHLHYTPRGSGLIPQEMHGNTPIRHFIPHTIRLYGVPSGNPTESTPVDVLVCWVPSTSAEEPWRNVVEAFEAYSIQRFEAAIIPANVAVESRLTKVFHDLLLHFASKERIVDFLQTKATYSYQLNVLLPLVTHYVGFPNLPEHVRGHLNNLRDLRNEIAHKGKLDSPVDSSSCAKLLCASLVGFAYIQLLEDHLNRSSRYN